MWALQATYTGIFPANMVLDKNWLGKSNQNNAEPYVGYIDSVLIYGVALDEHEATLLFRVRLCIVCFICVCKYLCVYVYFCVRVCVCICVYMHV
jgi:hypothetical protein